METRRLAVNRASIGFNCTCIPFDSTLDAYPASKNHAFNPRRLFITSSSFSPGHGLLYTGCQSVILIVMVWENQNTHRLAFSNPVSDLYHTRVFTVRTTSPRLSEFSPSRREINSLIPLLSQSLHPIHLSCTS